MANQLAIYDEARHDFVVEPGVFNFLLGARPRISAKAHFVVTAPQKQKR